jgi:hypothetical protein
MRYRLLASDRRGVESSSSPYRHQLSECSAIRKYRSPDIAVKVRIAVIQGLTELNRRRMTQRWRALLELTYQSSSCTARKLFL